MPSLKLAYRKATGLRWKLFYACLALSVIPLLFYANTILSTMDSAYTREKEFYIQMVCKADLPDA